MKMNTPTDPRSLLRAFRDSGGGLAAALGLKSSHECGNTRKAESHQLSTLSLKLKRNFQGMCNRWTENNGPVRIVSRNQTFVPFIKNGFPGSELVMDLAIWPASRSLVIDQKQGKYGVSGPGALTAVALSVPCDLYKACGAK